MASERERLLQVMEAENMSAKQFAEEIGIQAGTMSNIINGRNNPSLDVMKRVLNRFRTISGDWLILNVGSMYRPHGEMPSNVIFDIKPQEPADKPANEPVQETTTKATDQTSTLPVAQKTVSKVVIFYSDGTFEER